MNKVKFNLKNVHYCPIDSESGEYSETVYALPGAVSLSLDAKGDIETFYADGKVYYQSAANNGYSGSLEVALITEEFRVQILNEIKDETTKNITENANNQPLSFALAFQIDGDVKETLFWFFNCTVTRPSTEASTLEDSKTPATDSMSISCAPDENGRVKVTTSDDTSESDRKTWFDAVVTK